MKSAPAISLCMIVRNEEATLARCLEAAQPFVDEIVIVDTGSQDGTIQIAERFGARIIHEVWEDDFSAARNRSLEEARCEWILTLDADEVISPEAGAALKKIVARKEVICVSFDMRCAEAGGLETLSSMVRAFRRRDELRYRYRLHEQVLPDILKIAKAESLIREHCSGEIFHYGYLPEIVEAQNKDERNLRIYGLQLAETPNDMYMLFKYGDFVRRFPDQQEKSRELLKHAYELLKELSIKETQKLTYGGQICALLGQDFQRRGESDESWDVTLFGVQKCQATADLLYVHGNNALLRNDPAQADEAFQRCSNMAGTAGPISTLPHITGLGARMGMARARFLQGWDEEAGEDATKILQDHPESDEALDLWSDIHTRLANWPEMTRQLIELVTKSPDWGLAWLRGGETLFRMNLHQKAIPWLLRSTELLEDTGRSWSLAGECFLAMGMAEKAMDTFESGLPHLDCHAGLITLQVLCKIDPEETLNSSDQPLIEVCRQMLERIRRIPNHPLAHNLKEARDWIDSMESDNCAFLEQALSAAV